MLLHPDQWVLPLFFLPLDTVKGTEHRLVNEMSWPYYYGTPVGMNSVHTSDSTGHSCFSVWNFLWVSNHCISGFCTLYLRVTFYFWKHFVSRIHNRLLVSIISDRLCGVKCPFRHLALIFELWLLYLSHPDLYFWKHWICSDVYSNWNKSILESQTWEMKSRGLDGGWERHTEFKVAFLAPYASEARTNPAVKW